MSEAAPSKELLPRRRSSWGQVLWRIVRGGFVVYLLLLLLMALFERQLVYPAPSVDRGNWNPPGQQHEEVWVTADDGGQVHAWYYDYADAEHTILYCHGNGEHVADNHELMLLLKKHLHASVFIFDYRGYGKSPGKPNEAGVIADGLAAHRWLAQRTGRPTEDVVLVGRSLGGGVAAALAERQGAAALVLQSTFTRLTDAATSHFPWLPVRWLMRNRFNTVDRIAQFKGPLLISHGTKDLVVPYEQGERLFDACPSAQKQFVPLDGRGHNDPQPSKYYADFHDFLKEVGEQKLQVTERVAK